MIVAVVVVVVAHAAWRHCELRLFPRAKVLRPIHRVEFQAQTPWDAIA